MRIADLQEGMSRAGEILAKGRKARSDAQKAITLVRLKKDGAESKMHDAASKHTDLKAAQEYHDRLVKLNPKSTIAHNVYTDNSLTDTWTGARTISEDATSGATASGNVATVAQPMNWISRRVPAAKLVKSERKTPKK